MVKKVIKPVEELNYEDAFQELRALVEKLESNDQQLEEGLQLFERGQLLVDRCTQLLEEAELKIKEISTKASGDFVERDFNIEEK
jgi:exodeoxyribonuclease VII small subunit